MFDLPEIATLASQMRASLPALSAWGTVLGRGTLFVEVTERRSDRRKGAYDAQDGVMRPYPAYASLAAR